MCLSLMCDFGCNKMSALYEKKKNLRLSVKECVKSYEDCEKQKNCVVNSPFGKRARVSKKKRLVGEAGGQTKILGSKVKLAVNLGEGGFSSGSQQPISTFFKRGLPVFNGSGGNSNSKQIISEKFNLQLGCDNLERFGEENVGTSKKGRVNKQKRKERK